MASEDYVCLNIECRYRSSQPFPFCPMCGHRNTFVTQSDMRVRGCIGGTLFFGIGCFLLLIAVFASVVFANKHTALRVNDVAALLLLYGLSAVFLIGGISIAIGGGRWFIRSIIAFATRGRASRVRPPSDDNLHG
jgi:hypothetical protein